MEEKKKKIRKRILLGLIPVGLIVLAFLIENLYIRFATPKEYMIQTENQFDYQPHYECSGYAAAYVLRSLGVEADGMELYQQITNKNADGTVPVPNLVSFLKKKDYEAKVCHGTVWELKNAISKGVPAIAFVRIYPGAKYYHYLPIVGYDEENFYAADSLIYLKNADDKHYNRKISITDFEKMWSTEVETDNTYIMLKLK